MKKSFLIIATFFVALTTTFAQAPQKMSYQAVIRDASNNLLVNKNVGMQVSLLQGTATGTASFVETQTATTNANGLVSIEIGTGTAVAGTFADIDWSAGPFFIKTETDPAGGSNYTITGVSQLLSVPYALYAANAALAWGMQGNAATNTSFIGTTNDRPLYLKVNNVKSGEIDRIYGTTSFGYNAGQSSSPGLYNVSIGTESAALSSRGSANTAVGYESLYRATGNTNTAIGFQTLVSNTSGSNNVAVGSNAGLVIATGNNNVAIGATADVTDGSLTNTVALGYNAKVNASNKVRIGDTRVTVIEGQVPFTAASDRRHKTLIKPLTEGMDFIAKLKPVSYKLKTGDSRTNWGFIAQDIEKLVGANNGVLTIGGDKDRTLGLRYTDLISPMVKAMQELKAENTDLKKQLEAMKQKEVEFSQRLARLEQALNKDELVVASASTRGPSKKGVGATSKVGRSK